MTESHFGDIRQLIIDQLKLSNHDIYVVVAWVTDIHLFNILLEKVKSGIEVTIILVDDEINRNNGFNYDNFIQNGGTIYWDNHHHKFCIIDRRTLITGSYNWTYAANNRVGRENILIIKNEDELIDKYALEYQTLKKQARKHLILQEEKVRIVEIEKPVIVEKIIQDLVIDSSMRKAGWFDTHQKRVEWWKSLTNLWKNIFVNANYIKDFVKPQKEELKYIFETDNLSFNEDFEVDDYSGLKNLSRLKILSGLKLSKSSKQIIAKILPDLQITD